MSEFITLWQSLYFRLLIIYYVNTFLLVFKLLFYIKNYFYKKLFPQDLDHAYQHHILLFLYLKVHFY